MVLLVGEARLFALIWSVGDLWLCGLIGCGIVLVLGCFSMLVLSEFGLECLFCALGVSGCWDAPG